MLGSIASWVFTRAGSTLVLVQEREEERARMVQEQIVGRGLTNPLVLEAMRRVPRHCFVEQRDASLAYQDGALSIGFEQTISQPFVVALMTDALEIGPTSRVLEIGTGSGYQTAVLAEITAALWTVEIVEALAQRAESTFERLGYSRIQLRIGDGAFGWPDEAPFDAILVSAAPARIPRRLFEQLRPGGRMCVPVGPRDGRQELTIVEKTRDGEMQTRDILGVRFVPMTGELGK